MQTPIAGLLPWSEAPVLHVSPKAMVWLKKALDATQAVLYFSNPTIERPHGWHPFRGYYDVIGASLSYGNAKIWLQHELSAANNKYPRRGWWPPAQQGPRLFYRTTIVDE